MIGRSSARFWAPDVYVSVTHSGVTLAPILARHATREIVDGDRVDALARYRPERFSEQVANASSIGLEASILRG
jgi:glycine/D-amino acid oxidase-like deaminating enzyme